MPIPIAQAGVHGAVPKKALLDAALSPTTGEGAPDGGVIISAFSEALVSATLAHRPDTPAGDATPARDHDAAPPHHEARDHDTGGDKGASATATPAIPLALTLLALPAEVVHALPLARLSGDPLDGRHAAMPGAGAGAPTSGTGAPTSSAMVAGVSTGAPTSSARAAGVVSPNSHISQGGNLTSVGAPAGRAAQGNAPTFLASAGHLPAAASRRQASLATGDIKLPARAENTRPLARADERGLSVRMGATNTPASPPAAALPPSSAPHAEATTHARAASAVQLAATLTLEPVRSGHAPSPPLQSYGQPAAAQGMAQHLTAGHQTSGTATRIVADLAVARPASQPRDPRADGTAAATTGRLADGAAASTAIGGSANGATATAAMAATRPSAPGGQTAAEMALLQSTLAPRGAEAILPPMNEAIRGRSLHGEEDTAARVRSSAHPEAALAGALAGTARALGAVAAAPEQELAALTQPAQTVASGGPSVRRSARETVAAAMSPTDSAPAAHTNGTAARGTDSGQIIPPGLTIAPASREHEQGAAPLKRPDGDSAALRPIVEGIFVRQATLRTTPSSSSFHVVLQPRALGMVTVHVERGAAGLQVTLVPQRTETHALLDKHLPELISQLSVGTGDSAAPRVNVVAPGTPGLAASSTPPTTAHNGNGGAMQPGQGFSTGAEARQQPFDQHGPAPEWSFGETGVGRPGMAPAATVEIRRVLAGRVSMNGAARLDVQA